MQYFDHSTAASSDDKIIALRMFYGHGAIDAYWALVERVHRDEAPMKDDRFSIGSFAQTLCEDAETVNGWLKGMIEIGLVDKTEDGYTSKRMAENIDRYHAKVEQSSNAGKASAAKRKQRKANRKPTTVERPLNDRATNKTKQNKEDVELLKAQQSSSTHNGVGESQSAAADAEEDSWDWDADMSDLMRELMVDA